MDDRVRRLLKVFVELTPQQRAEVVKALNFYEERGVLSESVTKDLRVTMGPLGGACPYCGR